MILHRQKVYSLTYTHYFAGIITVMFLVSIFLTFKLLNNDCNKITSSSKQVVGKEQQLFANQKLYLNQGFHETKHKLAVLVPFRDRFDELLEFAPHLHNFLNDQRVNHDIFVLNQVDKYRFNRASLINVGYLQTKKEYDYIAMHDVDLLPLNKNLSYAYANRPMHLAAPNLHPRYHYSKFIGGILLINREDFNTVKGLSNKYWGWGLEDDEFYVRLKDANLTVSRPENISTGTNNTFRHIHGRDRKRDTQKCHNQREITRKRDRQTGLHDLKYNVIDYKSMTISSAPLTIINIELICDLNNTPWCDCSGKTTTTK